MIDRYGSADRVFFHSVALKNVVWKKEKDDELTWLHPLASPSSAPRPPSCQSLRSGSERKKRKRRVRSLAVTAASGISLFVSPLAAHGSASSWVVVAGKQGLWPKRYDHTKCGTSALARKESERSRVRAAHLKRATALRSDQVCSLTARGPRLPTASVLFRRRLRFRFSCQSPSCGAASEIMAPFLSSLLFFRGARRAHARAFCCFRSLPVASDRFRSRPVAPPRVTAKAIAFLSFFGPAIAFSVHFRHMTLV